MQILHSEWQFFAKEKVLVSIVQIAFRSRRSGFKKVDWVWRTRAVSVTIGAMESKQAQLDPAAAKAVVDALKARPASDRKKIADAFRGGRFGSQFAEQMFRNWGATLPCEQAKESFVYDCMLAAGFKYDLVKEIYYHPKSKTAAKFLAKN